MTAATGQADPVSEASCPQCGYSRAGLDPSQICPECGAPAPPPADLLPVDAANAIWVADIRNGLRLVLVACIVGIIAVVVSTVLTAIVPTQAPRDAAFSLGLVIASILGARGWWVATRPEPFVSMTGNRHLIDMVVRVSAIGAAAALGGGAIVISIASLLGAVAVTEVLTRAMAVAAAIAGLVHVPTALAFELHIARLTRDARLVKSCRQGVWLLPASHAVYGLTAFIPGVQAWVRGFGGAGLPSSIFGLFLAIVVAVASVVTLITPLAYALVTWRTYRRVRASIRRREAAEAAARTAAAAIP